MQGYLTRYQKLDGVFTINDPQAIGSDFAAKQLSRGNIVITSVDGAPDIEKALKSNTLIEASASQDPFKMAKLGVSSAMTCSMEKSLRKQKPSSRLNS